MWAGSDSFQYGEHMPALHAQEFASPTIGLVQMLSLGPVQLLEVRNESMYSTSRSRLMQRGSAALAHLALGQGSCLTRRQSLAESQARSSSLRTLWGVSGIDCGWRGGAYPEYWPLARVARRRDASEMKAFMLVNTVVMGEFWWR
jgi:hypothetical protein